MNKAIKMIVMVAALVVAAGIVLIGIGYAISGSFWSVGFSNGRIQIGELGDWDADWATNATRRSIDLEAFQNIDIDGNCFEIELIPTDEQTYFAFLTTQGKLKQPDVRVENGTLKITTEREPLNSNGFGNNRRLLQIYYPRGTQFDQIKLDIEAAELRANSLTVNDFYLDLAAGSIELEDAYFKTADVNMNAGDISIDRGTVETMKLNVNAGNFEADEFESQGLEVDINMGNIEIDGELKGKSNLDVDMGNIELSLRGRREEYRMDLDTNLGMIEVDGRESRSYQQGEATRGEITAKVNMGTLEISCD